MKPVPLRVTARRTQAVRVGKGVHSGDKRPLLVFFQIESRAADSCRQDVRRRGKPGDAWRLRCRRPVLV